MLGLKLNHVSKSGHRSSRHLECITGDIYGVMNVESAVTKSRWQQVGCGDHSATPN